MPYFAELDYNNIVKRVIVLHEDSVKDSNEVESEEVGIQYCKELALDEDSKWIQTFMDGSARVRPAAIGHTYNEELDAFIPPKPYESWVLNTTTADWESPIGPQPERTQEDIDANLSYFWIEETQDWRLSTLMQMIQQDLKS